MTTPEPEAAAPQPPAPGGRDRVHRSPGGIAGGVLLLTVIGWLGLDALFTGHGRTPWLALAALTLVVPLVVAFTVRPAVYADDERLRIRNPLRVVVLPWGQVAALRSHFCNEVITRSGTTYQLWAVPVSMRARTRAVRRQARAAGERGEGRLPRPHGLSGRPAPAPRQPDTAGRAGPTRATTDQIMSDLRALHETRERDARAQGEASVRWAYEILGPAAAGAVVLAVVLTVG